MNLACLGVIHKTRVLNERCALDHHPSVENAHSAECRDWNEMPSLQLPMEHPQSQPDISRGYPSVDSAEISIPTPVFSRSQASKTGASLGRYDFGAQALLNNNDFIDDLLQMGIGKRTSGNIPARPSRVKPYNHS